MAVRNEKIIARKAQLKRENANLLKQVELARQQLIQLEQANGKMQITVPAGGQTTKAAEAPVANPTDKPPTDKKPKKEKPVVADEAAIDIGRLDMRVGRIVEVAKHPDADSLYVEQIECGEDRPRTVVSGLVKFVPIEQMQGRMVVILCNLKPAKMRGVLSEAMVMCASSPEAVEVLTPPAGSVPGDLVHCDGYVRAPDAQLNPKKKIFETCAPDLKTNDALAACYKGVPWTVPGKGHIRAQTLKGAPVK